MGHPEPVPPDEPAPRHLDYRFTLANERTFLAWLRTSLGLLAAAVAITQLVPTLGQSWLRPALGVLLGLAGLVTAALAHRQWARVEAAMRADEELPVSRVPTVVAAVLVLAGIAVVVVALVR